jgi:hypothetical protein
MPRVNKNGRFLVAFKSVTEWLLEENQPSMRYLTLRDLLDKPKNDPDCILALNAVTTRGWAADIFAQQSPDGTWHSGESFYRPRYLSSHWMLLVLSDLAVTKKDNRIELACDQWIKRMAKKDGGFSWDSARNSEMCITGSVAKALIKFGYVDHPKVKSSIDWLIKDQKENGGWRCGWRRGILDGWEPMSLFAAYPKQKWTRGIKRAVERGSEFYLDRELHMEGAKYEPWYRFHYPTHYYYDILVGLDFMTALGFTSDRRLNYAISLLNEKRRHDGKWKLDAVHPDIEGLAAVPYVRKPPNPFSLEKPGLPSKMITLRALTILKRLET